MLYERYNDRLYGKIEKALTAYENLLFVKVGEMTDAVALETEEHLRSVPADGWQPISEGKKWGGEWQNLWVKGTAAAPACSVGKKLYAMADTGAKETMFFVNGKPRGLFNNGASAGDHFAEYIATPTAEGEKYELALEGYAWHYIPGCSPFDNYGKDVADPGEFDRVYKGVSLAVMDEEVRDFYFGLLNLVEMVRSLHDDNIVKAKAANALEELFPHLVQYPINREEATWREGVRECNKIISEFFSAENTETTRGHVGIIGHSHMDTAWLWPVSETVRKCARTYCNALSLMEQYPEYKFIQSSALHSDWMRRYYPTIFADMQKRVAENRYEPNGGVWVECDCNITSGEFMIRQFLKGQLFSRKYFNFTPDCFWLPDTFGYNAAIPQIMLGCEVKYFYTTKISWNDLNVFPLDTFYWQGSDGSKVLTHFNVGHADADAKTVLRAFDEIAHKQVYDGRLLAFGYGDGGGGPHFGMIENSRIVAKTDGLPQVKFTTVSDFMKDIEANAVNLPLYNGELYLELHRGTLTQMHDIKRNNRKAELAILGMEYFNVISGKKANEKNDEYVKTLLTNQFHDILPGTSIERVNVEARKEVTELIAAVNAERDAYAASLVADDSGKVTVFNTLSFERSDIITLEDAAGVEGAKAQQVTDITGKTVLAVSGVELSAFSAKTLTLADAPTPGSAFTYDGTRLETPYYIAVFDENGYISSLFDKNAGRQVERNGGAPLNTLWFAEDVPESWDDWDVDYDLSSKFRAIEALQSREVAADGAVEFVLRSVYGVGEKSSLKQDMIFYADSPRIDFRTVIDWQDKHSFLKAGFDVDVLADFAKHEIQYGHISRPTTSNSSLEASKFEVCNYRWTDLSEGRYGVAVLNDCKYGISVDGSDLRLSLHKGGCRPDITGDKGVHEVTYSLLPHVGALSTKAVIRPAYELNVPVLAVSGALKNDAKPFIELSADNIICESVKPAELLEDACVLRLYETERTKTTAALRLPEGAKKAYVTNMLEDIKQELVPENGSVTLTFHPFEIKTVLVQM